MRALPAAVEGARRARRRHWRPLLCSPVYSVDVSTWPVTPAAMAQPASLDRVDARATAWGEGADIFVVGCVCLPARGKSERRRRRRTRVLASSAIFFFSLRFHAAVAPATGKGAHSLSLRSPATCCLTRLRVPRRLPGRRTSTEKHSLSCIRLSAASFAFFLSLSHPADNSPHLTMVRARAEDRGE